MNISTGLIHQILNSIRGAVATTYSLEHGAIYVYSGSMPASADDAATGTLLGIASVGAGAFVHGNATNGLDLDAPASCLLTKAAAETWQFVGLANGTIGYVRHCGNPADAQGASTTLPRIDFRASTAGAEVTVSTLNVVIGATATIDSYVLDFSVLK